MKDKEAEYYLKRWKAICSLEDALSDFFYTGIYSKEVCDAVIELRKRLTEERAEATLGYLSAAVTEKA